MGEDRVTGRHRGDPSERGPLPRDPDRVWSSKVPLLLLVLGAAPLATAVGLLARGPSWGQVVLAVVLVLVGVAGFVALARWWTSAASDWHADRARRRR